MKWAKKKNGSKKPKYAQIIFPLNEFYEILAYFRNLFKNVQHFFFQIFRRNILFLFIIDIFFIFPNLLI